MRTTPMKNWLLAALMASTLAACSSLSGNKPPKPRELGADPGRVALAQVWSANVGSLGGIHLNPAVQGDSITLATAAGSVVSLNTQTGATLWQAKVGDRLVAGVGGDGQTFAVITAQNAVVALREGQEVWRYSLPGRAFTAPLVAGGRVFVATADRALFAFDAENGALIWDRPGAEDEALALREAVLLTAVGDTLVTGFSGRVAGVNPDNGSLRWETPISVPRGVNDIERLVDILAPFSREGTGLCVQSFQTAIGCINATSGATLWTQRLNGTQGVGGDGQSVYSVDASGRLQAWDRYEGRQRWLSDRLQHRKLTAPVALGDAVAVGDSGGLLHLIAGEDGSELTRIQTHKGGLRTPVRVGNLLIAIGNNGGVTALRLQ